MEVEHFLELKLSSNNLELIHELALPRGGLLKSVPALHMEKPGSLDRNQNQLVLPGTTWDYSLKRKSENSL